MTAKIGVYICHCGTNIAGTVDVESLVAFAKTLPDVVVLRDYKFMCSDPGQIMIQEDIAKLGLDRVVVASCSPLMHELTFRGACEKANLNRYLFQMANIREHCSWVTVDKGAATEKAKMLLSGAVAKARQLGPLEKRTVPVNPATLVVGGGITGIQAALDIANAGKQVFLVERDSTIGGHMAQFDKTFPTLDCAACILTPKMVSIGQHPNITLLTYSEVEQVSGYVGNFRVKVRKKARCVDMEKCNGCGICQEKCPYKAPSEFECGLSNRKAIYMAFPQAVPKVPVVDKATCQYFKTGKCKACVKFCPTGAVDLDQQDSFLDIEVGAIVLATGFQVFDASRIGAYRASRLPDVYTAMEFERMNSASGATGGEIRMKNGQKPRAVGIVHCVGSRDRRFNEHCSRVCCMYALKFAHLIKEKTDAEVYNFYIDMRCFGKGYEEFYQRLLEEEVRFVRGRVASITDFPMNEDERGRLLLRVEDTLLAQTRRIPVDMVILATGLEAHADAQQVARKFNISVGKDGFFIEKHPKLAPVSTATDGVYIAGACQGAKDIPDSIAQGSAAAGQVLSVLSRGEIEVEATTSEIIQDLCAGCRICNTLCPYSAIAFLEEEKVSRINEALCKGCGTCAAACPSCAIVAKHFTDLQVFSEIEGVLHDVRAQNCRVSL
ncbi:MAG: CoB--CoM heterodisulfide reductase iron-sulfur subunit A family protein [Pseudomonadota bacterium]